MAGRSILGVKRKGELLMTESKLDVGRVSKSVTRQVLEQSPVYGNGMEMSSYAIKPLTRPTELPEGWVLTTIGDIAAKCVQKKAN